MMKYAPVYLAIVTITGIIIQSVLQFRLTTLIYLVAILSLVSLVMSFVKKELTVISLFLTTISFLAIVVGMLILKIRGTEIPLSNTMSEIPAQVIVEGIVSDVSLYHKTSFQLEIGVLQISDSSRVFKPGGVLIINVRRDNSPPLRAIYDSISPGDTISVEGMLSRGSRKRNPGEFDYGAYLAKQGISGILINRQSDTVLVKPNRGFSFTNLRHRIRNYLAIQIETAFDFETSALLKGLLLGDKRDIPVDIQENFINSGTAHVLAVSGMNVAYFAFLAYLLLGRFSFRLRNAGAGVVILIFWFIAGTSPPVFRAVITGLIVVILNLMNRKTAFINVIAVSALIIIVISPSEIFTASFQLTYAGVLSLVLIYPVMKNLSGSRIENSSLRGILFLCLLTFSAILGVTPITTAYFGKFSLTSLVSNLAVVPLMALVMAGGILTLLVKPIVPFAGILLAEGENSLTAVSFWITKLTGHGEWTYISLSSFGLGACISYYCILALFFLTLKKFEHAPARMLLFFQLILLLLILHYYFDFSLLPPQRLNIIAIDVGQGDATLIQFPDKTTLLIDAGNANRFKDNGKTVLRPLLEYLGIQKVDYGIITHPDADHCNGIAALLNERKIKVLIKRKYSNGARTDSLIESFAAESCQRIERPKDIFLNIGGARVYLLNSSEIEVSDKSLKANDRSICAKIVYGNTSFLFTGDSESKREQALINRFGEFLHSNVIKIPHHGSRLGSTLQFLESVKPETAILSVGKINRYGHPHKVILDRYTELGVRIFRTDLSGAIILTSDGASISSVDYR